MHKKNKAFLKSSHKRLLNPKNYGNPLNLWLCQTQTVISNFNAIEENVTLTYETCSFSKIFRKFFPSLAESLLNKLLNPPDK